ncbi:unnamed protein product [Callosobruchus maculatus]|uniref:Lipase domain-containing protein n=1 Tax=Callosobruchus maculatus TaxID=64391 RepID=A0A653CCW5_CALMS|nr:unnamed protein product [Callosobruchus maculatus]
MDQSTRLLWFLLLQIYCGSAVEALGHSINVDISLYIYGSSDEEGYQIQYGTVKDDIPKLYYNWKNLNVFLIPDLNRALDELVGPLLETEDVNVFSFYYEDPKDIQSMSDTDKMTVITKGAELMAKFINQLNKTLGMDLDNIELIGHGEGTHIAGIIGSNLKTKIKSIVALDPTYPVHNIEDKEKVLDPTDAKNVHVIHTSGDTIGHSSNLGTADFYPNGGMSQPGCEEDKSGACSHQKAIDYYIASLKKGNVFVCFKCTSYKYVKNLELEKCHEYGLMGRLLPDNRVNGTHYCITKSRPPYLYSIVPDPNEVLEVTVSTKALPITSLSSLHWTVFEQPKSSPITDTPTTPGTLAPKTEPNSITRITNVYSLKDLASQLENELQSIVDSPILEDIKHPTINKSESSPLANSVEKYVSSAIRRLSNYIPGYDLDQVIADLQVITRDLEYPLDLVKSRRILVPAPVKLEQFMDRLKELQNDTRQAFEHLKQVIKEPDSNFTEIEMTLGMINNIAIDLKLNKPGAFNENGLRKLIHTVQHYLQLIAKQISGSSIAMRPGDGEREYRGLIQRMVDIFDPLREADKLLLEILTKGHRSLLLVQVKQFLETACRELLIVAEPVSKVEVHRAIPEVGLLKIKDSLEDVLAYFLQTIERSVNWPMTKKELAKIKDYISYSIAAAMNSLPFQLYVSPNFKVDRIVEKIVGKLKVLARTIFGLVNHGKDGSFETVVLVEILQNIQNLTESIHEDLQNVHSIDALLLDGDELSQFSSLLQELSAEVKLVLQQVSVTASLTPELGQLIWKAEKLYLYTKHVIYGPLSRDSGLMYHDLFER